MSWWTGARASPVNLLTLKGSETGWEPVLVPDTAVRIAIEIGIETVIVIGIGLQSIPLSERRSRTRIPV